MALDPTLLAQLLGQHPARRMPFDELRAGLVRNVERKRVNRSRDGDLELYSYSSLCQFEQQWDLFSLIARGLILDTAQRRVVATPFPKFFNFGEAGSTLPEEPFEASEKIDGSLGIVFHHNGNWRVSTRGQLASPQGAWASKHLQARINTAGLMPGATYLVEIIYAENRVVVPYDFEGLVLLGAYDENGHELPRPALELAARTAGLRMARSIAFPSFAGMVDVARKLSRFEEGFVVRFAGGLRLKLKGEAYCRIHKLICRCTPLAIWESMMMLEDLESVGQELPEEMRHDFNSIRRLLKARFDTLLEEVRSGHERLGGCNDKELGLLIQTAAPGVTEAQKKFAFACRNRNFLQMVHQKGEWREKFFKFMRPDGNRLPGYAPSDAMTRFAEENG